MTSKIPAGPNNLWWLILAAVPVALPYLPGPILSPLRFAAILACKNRPLVNWRRRVTRTPGARYRNSSLYRK
jgi:predicted PurR-regulated permease PerM